MNGEAMAEFFKFLSNFEPRWVLILLVAGILSWPAPRIIKELFAGVRGLLVALKQNRKAAKKP
jgi:hypothetical protein